MSPQRGRRLRLSIEPGAGQGELIPAPGDGLAHPAVAGLDDAWSHPHRDARGRITAHRPVSQPRAMARDVSGARWPSSTVRRGPRHERDRGSLGYFREAERWIISTMLSVFIIP